MATRTPWMNLAAGSLLLAMAGCTSTGSGPGWTKLIDGANGIENFVRVGEANWSASDGAVHASKVATQ